MNTNVNVNTAPDNHSDNHTDNHKGGNFKSNVKNGLGRGVGFAMGFSAVLIVGAVVIAILGNIFTARSDDANVSTTPAHTKEVSLVVNEDDMLIAPGESRTITGKLKNGSKTDSCYVFVEVVYDDEACSIETEPGWVKVEDGIYAYGDDVMTPVECGEELQFKITGTVIAEGTVYQGLRKEDFKISMKGMAINTSVSRDGVSESYQDYENDGNAAMISVIEGA